MDLGESWSDINCSSACDSCRHNGFTFINVHRKSSKYHPADGHSQFYLFCHFGLILIANSFGRTEFFFDWMIFLKILLLVNNLITLRINYSTEEKKRNSTTFSFSRFWSCVWHFIVHFVYICSFIEIGKTMTRTTCILHPNASGSMFIIACVWTTQHIHIKNRLACCHCMLRTARVTCFQRHSIEKKSECMWFSKLKKLKRATTMYIYRSVQPAVALVVYKVTEHAVCWKYNKCFIENLTIS